MLHEHILSVETSLKLFTNDNKHNVGELHASLESIHSQLEYLHGNTKSNYEQIRTVQEDHYQTKEKVIGLKSDFLDIINTNWKQLMDKIKKLEDKSNDLKLVSENSQRISVENSTHIESI